MNMEERSFVDELIKIEQSIQEENNISTNEPKKKSKNNEKPIIDTESILNEAEDNIENSNEINEIDYIKYSDGDKVNFIERELVKTIKEVDKNLESIDIYERKLIVKGFPAHLYETKNSFIETRRKVLKELFDIIAHKQKMEKEVKGDTFTEIIKSS